MASPSCAPWAILFALVLINGVQNAASQTLGSDGTLTFTPPAATPSPEAAATVAYCNMTPTWFPKGYEDAAFPDPLQYTSQTAAGWDGTGDPLRVAISNYGSPKFYLGVNWFMLEQNKVPAECAAGLNSLLCPASSTVISKETAVAGRRLLQTSTVLTPVTYDISWSLNNGVPEALGSFKPGQNRAAPFIDMRKTYGALLDGDYCVKAMITALARSGSVSVGGKAYDVPCNNITKTQMFCFTKVVEHPYAKVKYNSCNRNFTVDFGSITPAAQYAKVSKLAAEPPQQLFSVIVHLYGNGTGNINDNRTADELPPDEILDTRLEITDPLQTKATFSTDQLRDGKYIFHVQMLLKSTFPMLNNLSGPTFNDDGTATYQGVLVNGSKGDHVTIYHEKSDVFGLQCPSDAVIALPAERVFQWQYLGAGSFNCYVDGVLKNNAEEGCASPYTLNLKDKKNHTLTVVFNDVCKQSIVKKMVFGSWGCVIDKRGEPPAPPPPPPPAPEAAPTDGGLSGFGFGGTLGNLSSTASSAAVVQFPLAAGIWAAIALMASLLLFVQ